MTTQNNPNPEATPDGPVMAEPTWATSATYAREATSAAYPKDQVGSTTPAAPATVGATAMPGTPRRGIAPFTILLGLIALGVAPAVGSYEVDQRIGPGYVDGAWTAGFGGLLVLLALVGLVISRRSRSPRSRSPRSRSPRSRSPRSRSRRARGGGAPSA